MSSLSAVPEWLEHQPVCCAHCNALMFRPQIYVAIESRKREVLDKHLDMIVGQTERFSKMLAQVSNVFVMPSVDMQVGQPTCGACKQARMRHGLCTCTAS